jgi:hypothetical protein
MQAWRRKCSPLASLRPRSRRTLAKMKRGLSEEAPRCRRGFGILNALVQGPFSLILAALPNNFHFG